MEKFANNSGNHNAKSGQIKQFCLPAYQPINTKGIWLGDNPLDYPYPLMLIQIILVVFISRLLYFLLRPLGQTKFVCNLLGGIIMGPSALGSNKIFKDKISFGDKKIPLSGTIAMLGILYSIFLNVVKFDMGMMRRTVKNGWKIAVGGFLCPMAVSLFFVYALGDGTIPGFNGGRIAPIFATFALSSNYFPVITEALDEFNLTTSELGQLAMSASMVNDIIQYTFASAHVILLQKNTSQSIKAFVSLIGLILFTFLVVRRLIRLIINNTPEGQDVKEIYVVALQLGVMVMCFLADAIGMRSMTGAVLMGLVIPGGPPLGAALIAKTELIINEILLPMFFFRVGLDINLFKITDSTGFFKLHSIILLTYLTKNVALIVTGLRCKFEFKSSLLLSMIMNIKGTMELFIYSRWMKLNMIDEQCFSQIMLSVLGVTMVAAPIVRFLYMPQSRLRPTLYKYLLARNIQSLQSASEAFQILFCVHDEQSVANIVTLLEASNPTQRSPICAYVIHAVELVGRATPLLVPCKKKKKSSKFNPTYQMMRALENYTENSIGPVTIQAYIMVAPYKSMHNIVFRVADDKLVPLIIIPFHENHRRVVGPSNMSAAIRQFNSNVQSYALCTVGILVDRTGLSCQQSKFSANLSSYNVGVFFIGGPDDREALAYAARLAGNPNLSITVFRIIALDKKEDNGENQKEEMMDKWMIEEFKLKNTGNDRLNWRHIVVNDGVEVMDAIRQLEDNYDLVMVGRRHADMTIGDDEMADFVENAELGVIGDMLASSDFCGGMVSVLVMQESCELSSESFATNSLKDSESTRLFLDKGILP